MAKKESSKQTLPPEEQDRQPGIESEMEPRPRAEGSHRACGKLEGKVALSTGGDSGIGRAVAYAFAAEDFPLGRPGQPEEVAPCFVFLASEESSYLTGQVLYPNGGEVVNG